MPTGNSQQMSAIPNSKYYGSAFATNPQQLINRSALASLAPFIGQKNSELMMNATTTMASNNIWSSLKNTLEVIRAVSVSNVSTETFQPPLDSMSFTAKQGMTANVEGALFSGPAGPMENRPVDMRPLPSGKNVNMSGKDAAIEAMNKAGTFNATN